MATKTTPTAAETELKTEAPVTEKAEKKAPAKKAPAKKPAARKRTAKKAVSSSVSIQFDGKEYTTDALVQIAKDVWQYDLGNDPAEFKDVQLYVKPEEASVYYVINGDVTGRFII